MTDRSNDWGVPSGSKADYGILITVPSWRAFVSLVTKMEDRTAPHRVGFFCRGQEQDWALRPSLLRPATQAALNPGDVIELEDQLLHDFMDRARGHLPAEFLPSGPVLDVPSWWMLMQHYGAPTRLLDWTRSPYVAAYFAVSQGRPEPGVVWLAHAAGLVTAMASAGLQVLPDNLFEQRKLLTGTDSPAGLTFLQCKRLTDRMVAQQTFFSVSTQAMVDHSELITRAVAPEMAAIGDRGEADLTVAKVLIPPDLKLEFLRRLRFMNITGASLFPGIDGLGRSLSELARLAALHPRA